MELYLPIYLQAGTMFITVVTFQEPILPIYLQAGNWSIRVEVFWVSIRTMSRQAGNMSIRVEAFWVSIRPMSLQAGNMSIRFATLRWKLGRRRFHNASHLTHYNGHPQWKLTRGTISEPILPMFLQAATICKEIIHDKIQRTSEDLLQGDPWISEIVGSALQPPNEICMQLAVGQPVHACLDGLGATVGGDEHHWNSSEEIIHDEIQRASEESLQGDSYISGIVRSALQTPKEICMGPIPPMSPKPKFLLKTKIVNSIPKSESILFPTQLGASGFHNAFDKGSFMDVFSLTKTILILTCFFFSGLNAQRVGHQEPITWNCPLAGAATIRLYQNQLEVASCMTIGREICKSLYTNLKLYVDDWNGPKGFIFSMRDQTDGFIVEVFTRRLVSNRCNVTVPAEVTKPAMIATSTPSTQTPWTELDKPANSKNGMKITPLVGAVVAALVVLGGVVVGMIVFKKSRGIRQAGENAEKANKESSDSSKSSEVPLKQWIDI